MRLFCAGCEEPFGPRACPPIPPPKIRRPRPPSASAESRSGSNIYYLLLRELVLKWISSTDRTHVSDGRPGLDGPRRRPASAAPSYHREGLRVLEALGATALPWG
eukprot:scaffold28606_cov118-Isochrysis_galbana.AAC.3